MACLTASIFFWIVYFLMVLYSEWHIVWQYTDAKTFNCTYTFVGNLPAIFLLIGILLNLNKWIMYLSKIFAFVRVSS